MNARERWNCWKEAFNAHDAAALAALYHPDAVLFHAALGELLTGREEIEASFRRMFASFPDFHAEPQSILTCDEGWMVVESKKTGTFLGPLDEIAPTGRSFVMRACGVVRVRDDLIALHRRYFDRYNWYAQIGTLAS